MFKTLNHICLYFINNPEKTGLLAYILSVLYLLFAFEASFLVALLFALLFAILLMLPVGLVFMIVFAAYSAIYSLTTE